MKAYHHCLLLFSTLIAINYSAVAAPSAAQNSLHMARDPVLYPHVEQDIPGQEEQKLRDTETLLLGPTHAAEHAEARAQAKAVAKQAAAQAPLKRFLAQLGLNDHFPSFKQALAGVIGTSHAAIGTPAQVGRWSTPIKIPVVGIHAALLHNGKILFFSYRPPKTTSVGVAYLWNPRTNTGKRVDPPNNIWCGGQTLLADGRLLVAGGNLAYKTSATRTARGLNQIYIFNPYNERWIRQPNMRHGRWYPTLTKLADGRVVITSGLDEKGGGIINPDVEVFTPSAGLNGVGTVRMVGQYKTSNFYPHQFVLPSGQMLLAGPGRVDSASLNPINWLWSDIPNLLQQRYGYSTGTLLPAGPNGSNKVMLVGGRTTTIVHASSEVFDAANPAGGWKYLSALPQPRHNQNTVILPDGKLLTIGGNSAVTNYDRPQREAALYDPVSNTWSAMASQTEQRAYHSTALLLPDARVVSAGDDGATGGGAAADKVEFYSPPYLFRGARPAIGSVPAAVTWGETFFIGTADTVTRAVLIAPGATTHANDMHQRHVELSFTPGSGGINAGAPPNANVAPPGYYMLFILNAQGVPSVAKWMRLG